MPTQPAKPNHPITQSTIPPFARLGLVFAAFATFVLLGCSGEWSFNDTWTFQPHHRAEDRAERPVATSTPRAAAQTGAQLPKPVPGLSKPSTADHVAPVSTPNLADLATEEQLAHVVVPTRDLRDLALRLDPAIGPEADAIPLVVNEHTPDYQVGERLNFWVHNLDTLENNEITAELIHRTDVAYAWLEVEHAANHDAIIQAVDAFSHDIYPTLVDFFGSEWNPGVDNDPRLHILHSTQLGRGIAGYYSSADQYSRLANAYSNEKEMFYINLSIIPASGDTTYYETVLAHEFQHMIHWYQDRNETTWVNEGLSEYAPEVAGYEPNTQFAQAFARSPHTQLNTWSQVQGQNAPHYGAAYLFIHYFKQRFGQEMTRALVASPANGIQGFNDVLAGAELGPQDGYGFDGLFADWVVANYVDDPYALPCTGLGCMEPDDPIFGYLGLEQIPPTLHARHSDYPVDPPPNELPNYATHYILLEAPDDIPATDAEIDLVFHFLGEVDAVLAQADWLTTPAGRTRAWWSNRGDDFNTRLTRAFDLRDLEPGTPAEMLVRMWWDIEADYDFGYIVASLDGERWDVLPGDYTTQDDPTGASFGPGYTGQSAELTGDPARAESVPDGVIDGMIDGGWVVESIDLSAYVGEVVQVRFEYVTDDAINTAGWFIDAVQIPALDYAEDFEIDDGGWQSEGWLLTDNHLEQRWLVQILHLEANRLVELERYTADGEGRIVAPIAALGNDRTAVIAISPTTPVTTVPAPYTYHIERTE